MIYNVLMKNITLKMIMKKIAEFVTNKFLEKTISNPSVLPIGDETTQVLNECIKKYFETNKKENANE